MQTEKCQLWINSEEKEVKMKHSIQAPVCANEYSKIKQYDARYKRDTEGENSPGVIGTSRRV